MLVTDTPITDPQSAGAVLMVRPACFAFNTETAPSNAFQLVAGAAAGATQSQALREFDALAELLQRAGVEVLIGEDTVAPPKPDAIFPNNWVSFHRDGTVVQYPMLAPNRRLERRDQLIDEVARHGNFHIARTIDLSAHEVEGKYLEGTGSMVLDRVNRVAYACVSPRTDLDVLGEFAQLLGFELVIFAAVDEAGSAIYHTNVLMAVGSRFAVLCPDVIRDHSQLQAVRAKLRSTLHELIEISAAQMQRFAGNLLELTPAAGTVLALSTSAWRSFTAAERRTLERYGGVLAADIPVIERCGGGGVRCMLAEVHLRKRGAAAGVAPVGLMS